MARAKKQATQKTSPKKRNHDFKMELTEIPNGTRMPKETCQFLEAMRNWRAESAQSKILIR